jgi:hypothetical protein
MTDENAASDDGKALEDRYVLFFDFLGASEAARHWPPARIHEFLDLLIMVSHTRASERIDGGPMDDGGYKFQITPEITTFSDNVVVSYSTRETAPDLWTQIICHDAIRILSIMAERALRIGLILRGGLAYGQCYHSEGVVFGEAMVEAYRIESTISKNPRVVVAQNVLDRLKPHRPEDASQILHQDEDGRWYLNYFRRMMFHGVTLGSDENEKARAWKEAHANRIRMVTEELARDGKEGPAAKWAWFGTRFANITLAESKEDPKWLTRPKTEFDGS